MFRSLSTAVLLLLLALPGVALAQGTGTIAGRVLEADGVTAIIGANVRVAGHHPRRRHRHRRQLPHHRCPGRLATTSPRRTPAIQSSDRHGRGDQRGLDPAVELHARRESTTDDGRHRLRGPADHQRRRRAVARGDGPGPREPPDPRRRRRRSRSRAASSTRRARTSSTSAAVAPRRSSTTSTASACAGSQLGVNQQAIEQQEVLIGTIPARYGDVQSGVISITTKTGRNDFFGSVEGVTSTGLDSFGYNLGSISLGGPIVANRVGFFLSAEGQSTEDVSPYGADTYRLQRRRLRRAPAQPAGRSRSARRHARARHDDTYTGGTLSYIPFPYDVVGLADGHHAGLAADAPPRQRHLTPDQTLANPSLRSGADAHLAGPVRPRPRQERPARAT